MQFQLFCRHELHVVLPCSTIKENDRNHYSHGEILEGNFIEDIIRGVLPVGIRVEVPAYELIETADCNMAIFLIIYSGETMPITRMDADKYREMAEKEVSKFLTLRANRVGRPVSKPFPYSLLQSFIHEYKK